MSDRARIKELTKRLAELELIPCKEWQKPILRVACDALRVEIGSLARALVRRNYWRHAEPLPIGASGRLGR